MVLVSALTFRIRHGSRNLAQTLVDTTRQLGAIADTLQIMLQPHAIVDADVPLALAEGDAHFEEVRFAYPERAAVLEGLNLHLQAGQKVGIVGPSGAGKSTVIALIQRLDDVESGCVLIDGQDIRGVSQDSLREKSAAVAQETALFNRSIGDNIRYGRPDASDAEVHKAARHAFCDGSSGNCPRATTPRWASAG